jgi:hypothetical protein
VAARRQPGGGREPAQARADHRHPSHPATVTAAGRPNG